MPHGMNRGHDTQLGAEISRMPTEFYRAIQTVRA